MKEQRIMADAYELYEEKANELGHQVVKMPAFRKITSGLLRHMVDNILDGKDVMMAAGLGAVTVRGVKTEPRLTKEGKIVGVAPSWSKTKQLWEDKAKEDGKTLKEFIDTTPKEDRGMVYCFNEHTNGIRYHLVWGKKDVTIKNKTYYNMVFVRPFRRKLWKKLMEGKEYQVYRTDIKRKNKNNGTL